MVYGGESEARIPFDAEVNSIYIDESCSDENEWCEREVKNDLKPPMRIASAQVINKGDEEDVDEDVILYMFGGRLGPDGDKEVPLNDLWKFNFYSGEWEPIQ